MGAEEEEDDDDDDDVVVVDVVVDDDGKWLTVNGDDEVSDSCSFVGGELDPSVVTSLEFKVRFELVFEFFPTNSKEIFSVASGIE